MSTDEKEQITQVPDGLKDVTNKKVKDPKKVAAGKALAEKNKRAREALRREEERGAENKEEKERGESEQRTYGNSWTPEISFSNVLTVIGIGLTIVSLYREYKNGAKNGQTGLFPATECKTGVRLGSPLARGEESNTKAVARSTDRQSREPSRNKIGME